MTIKDITKEFLSQVGYHEKKSNKLLYTDKNNGSKNFTKYADMLKNTNLLNGNKQGVSWCCVFIIAMFLDMFGEKMTHKILSIPNNSAAAGCPYFYKYMRKVKTPAVGDLVFFGTSEKPSHVGFIYKVNTLRIYTIEGNSGNAVKKHAYLKSNKKIYGYTRPYYEELSK